MFRCLLLNPLLIAVATVAGAAICRISGADWHPRDLAASAVIGLVAAEAAVIVALRRRGTTTAQMAMTALVAMVSQMLLSIVLSAAAIFTNQVDRAFVWWMLVMFWVTLLGVSAVLVRLVRAAATGPSGPAETTAH